VQLEANRVRGLLLGVPHRHRRVAAEAVGDGEARRFSTDSRSTGAVKTRSTVAVP
jgi:hypothetical protein